MRKGTAKYFSLALCFILVSISTVHATTYLPSPSVCWMRGGAGGAITCTIHVTTSVLFFSILVPHTTQASFSRFTSKAIKKLRLSQAQAKKLVKRLRLAFSHMSPDS